MLQRGVGGCSGFLRSNALIVGENKAGEHLGIDEAIAPLVGPWREQFVRNGIFNACLLYTSPSPRDRG